MEILNYDPKYKQQCIGIFESNIPKFFLPKELPACKEYFASIIASNYWVLEHQNEIIASGGIGIDGHAGRMHYGMVRNDWHKKGIGTRLFEFRLGKLIENPNIATIGLDTCQHNPNFFRRFGFVETSVKENGYGPGLHRIDMELKINR